MELSYRRVTGRTRSGRSWRGFSIGANLSVSRWEIPSCCEAEWRVQDMKEGTVEWFDLVFFGPYFHSTGAHTHTGFEGTWGRYSAHFPRPLVLNSHGNQCQLIGGLV